MEVQRTGPFRSYDCGPSAPLLPPLDTGVAQVFTDPQGPGVARAWVVSLSRLLAFRGGGLSKPLNGKSSVDLRAPGGMAGRLLGVDTGRQLGTNSRTFFRIFNCLFFFFFSPSSNE